MSSNTILMAAAGAALPLPVFVSSSTNRSTSAGNTVTAPASIQNGNLLIAVGLHTSNQQTMTPPSGFSVVYLDLDGSNSTFIAIKTASSESGNYTFTWTGVGNNTISMLVYNNANFVNTIGAITSATSNTSTAASITPTYLGTLCAMFSNESNQTVSTAPIGLTQRAVQTASGPSLAVYDLSNQPATATSAYTLVWTAGANSVVGIQFQVTNEPNLLPQFIASASTSNSVAGTTLVVNKPTGTVQGDLMVAVMACDGGARTWTGDTDWIEVADQGASPDLRIAYKVAGASEGSSYTFTLAGGIQKTSGSILTYRYASYDTVGSFVNNANPLNIPSVSPGQSQSMLLAAGARAASSIVIGTPPGMTTRVTDSDANSPSYVICDQPAGKGPTGVRSMSPGSSTTNSGIMIAIKPTRSL